MLNTIGSAIGSYIRIGQKRPHSPEHLKAIFRHVQQYGERPNDLLVGAEVCLDLASAEQQYSRFYIDQSLQFLDSIITKERVTAGNTVARAYFRRAELENWRHALSGEPLVDNYDELLGAAAAVLRIPFKPTNANLAEFVPVLLGARAQSLGKSGTCAGWFGRLALMREDRSVPKVDHTNPNWDAGVSLRNDSVTYIEPPIKLQVKLRQGNNRQSYGKYSRAGIGMIFADKQQFSKPDALVIKCLQERDLAEGNQPADELSEAYLDGLTASLRTEIINTKRLLSRAVSF